MIDPAVTPSLESLFGSFFEHAQTPMLVVDGELSIVAANQIAHETLDIDEAAPAGLLDGFWSVSATALMRMLDGVRRGLEVSPIAVRTSQDRLVEVGAFPIPLEDGVLIGIMVTDRASVDAAQRQLKEQEERYRSLFEWSPVAMKEEDFTGVKVWLDQLRRSGVTDLREHMAGNPDEVRRVIKSIRTSRANTATVDLLRAPSVLAVLQGFRDDELTPEVVSSFEEQFVTLWDGGSSYSADFVGVNFLNQPFECRLRWIVPRIPQGRDMSRVVVSLFDLTQLRATERRLQRLVADKDRFIASVSHELRTPLAAVFGLSEEIAENWERFDAPELRELMGLVAAQSAELSSIVDDLLVAANLEAGRIAVDVAEIDLHAVAEAAIADCARSAPDVPSIDVTGPTVIAAADVIRVRQILRNLITNALRYGGRDIRVRTGESSGPFVEVSDNGDGIDLQHREAVFVPYFQAGDDRVLGSLGLGLSISRELARRMGGDLTYVYSDGRSIFRLKLLSA
ncbi:MAG: HAMP domain-containing sensor histidine kinase [Acidimicrobiia bacterium]|nr:HAMP domain-containing sensor histidine kinase [Acidimicrobiia bacterium]